jgi:membrane protease YdiL (CAAX protease family)
MKAATEYDADKSFFLIRILRFLPKPLRANQSGQFVLAVLANVSTALMMVNLQSSPSIPWSVPVVMCFLWIAFRYFGGKWLPMSTAEARKECLGANRLTSKQWMLALPAGLLMAIFIIAFAILNYRFIEVPAEEMGLSEIPWWTLYPGLIIVSLIAGVSEEAGFRGYIQGPLQRMYGPVIAIGIAALFFWGAHLNHVNGLARFPSLFVMGIALGSLTYASGSILPSILTHVFADSVVFVGATAGIGPEQLWHPQLIRETGFDGQFVAALLVLFVTGFAAIFVMSKLAAVTNSDKTTLAA